MNLGIILAAGKSSRFGKTKQLHRIEGKPMVCYSIDVFKKILDETIVVTNSDCHNEIASYAKTIVNNEDSRLSSILSALDVSTNASNIVVHDAARPFIAAEDVLKLFNTQDVSQYYLGLVNGLLQRSSEGFSIAQREQFIELCTPQRIKGELFQELYRNHISSINCEIVPFAHKLNFSYQLIEGNRQRLRKITKPEDCC